MPALPFRHALDRPACASDGDCSTRSTLIGTASIEDSRALNEQGVFKLLQQALTDDDADLEQLLIDSTIIRAHQ
jgi:hypothetical protein